MAVLAWTAPACRGETIRFPWLLAASLASIALGGAARASDIPPLPIGGMAPALSLLSLDHGRQELAALRGRTVLVHFFATWCEPCRAEMAGLARLAGRLKERPFALLAVDVGEVPARVRRFLDAAPVPFPVLLDEDRAALKAWKVVGLPSSFVLDASQTLRLYAGGPVDWDDPDAMRLLDSLMPDTPADIHAAMPAAMPAATAAAPTGAGLPPLLPPLND